MYTLFSEIHHALFLKKYATKNWGVLVTQLFKKFSAIYGT
jgi:hypothetical protein